MIAPNEIGIRSMTIFNIGQSREREKVPGQIPSFFSGIPVQRPED
ncbi:hypothetical protein LEP1GSC047_3495 [Leptospira inadai serovar Lyme str. 10]|uniref:Uncharacterized protein n=1 Tax=Leptospira inadai serovar Lyme str. 10 TaxID=1049790 RepID=V6HE95_9LEPT|nr:hypothetical protein LEP1GSC047_3495 [Leptospira inadai serovar Lyme str. 10]